VISGLRFGLTGGHKFEFVAKDLCG
jgi:hypothetical protein